MFYDPPEVVIGLISRVYDPISAGKMKFYCFDGVKWVVMSLFYLFDDPEEVVKH